MTLDQLKRLKYACNECASSTIQIGQYIKMDRSDHTLQKALDHLTVLEEELMVISRCLLEVAVHEGHIERVDSDTVA